MYLSLESDVLFVKLCLLSRELKLFAYIFLWIGVINTTIFYHLFLLFKDLRFWILLC